MMANLKYDFVNDIFNVYKPIETPKVELNLPLFDSSIDITDWAGGVENGVPIIKPQTTTLETPQQTRYTMTNDYATELPILARVELTEEIPIQYTKEADNTQKTQTYNPTLRSNYIMKYFMDKGLEKHLAAGLVGNLIRESNLNISAKNPNGGAFGLAQWLGNRLAALFKKYGTSPTLDLQLDFIWHELNTTHKKGLEMIKKSKTAEEAAANAFGYYEFSVGPRGAIQNMIDHKLDGWKSYRDGISFANSLMA